MNLKLILNKNLPQVYIELEFNMLGVPKKLVKYVVHLSKRENYKKKKILSTSCPNCNQPVFGLKEF